MSTFPSIFCRSIVRLATIISLSVISCLAQTPTPSGSIPTDKPQEFRFISTTKTSTFEKELNDAAKQGFGFIRLAKAMNDNSLGGLISRDQGADKARYEYKVLATNRIGTLKKEFEAAAAEGYEFRGITTEAKAVPFTYPETIVIMERLISESKRRFDYKFISTQREKTTQKELDAAVNEGYVPIELAIGQDTNTASILFGGSNIYITIILSRDTGNPGAEMGKREYRFLQTTKVKTMEKEMNQLAKEGFQFHLTSIGSMTIMSRPPKEKTQRYEYMLLATQRTRTMQKELGEMGAKGHQFLGTSTGLGGLVSVMEHETGETGQAGKYEYKFLATTLEGTTQKEMNEALAAGYKFLEITSLGEKLIVLGRRMEAK